MRRTAGALVVVLVLLVACSSDEGDTTTTEPALAAGSTTDPGNPTTLPGADGPGSTTSATEGPGASSTSSTTTSTTKPPTPTTKPNTEVPPGSAPVTDDSTHGATARPADAKDVTVSSTQLFVIGGDTLYLVVEGTKVAKCHRLGYITVVTGSKIDVDLFSVPDNSFCTPSTDYKDSLALGVYGTGSYEIILNGDKVAEVDL